VLCEDAHLITWNSETSIEALGKFNFQQYWHVHLTCEVAMLREAYAAYLAEKEGKNA
jgi:hypothetical protein